jgi:plastocyanin
MRNRRQLLCELALTVASIAMRAGEARETSAQGHSAGGKVHKVTIENLRYEPQSLTVERDSRVVWVNEDLFPHTVTDTHKAFDSKEIASHTSWSYIARTPGTYAYGCTLHPTMTATLIVR